MGVNELPKALELADELELCWGDRRIDEAAAQLRRLHVENIALRRCALKYLDYLGVSEPNEALAADLSDPEMVGGLTKEGEQA